MDNTPQKEQDQKTKILLAALELFKRYGIKSVTMDDISRSLGISKKTLYQSFSDKDHLVTAACEMHLTGNCCEFENIMTSNANVLEKLLLINKHMRQEMSEVNLSFIYDLQKYHRNAFQLLKDHEDKELSGYMVSLMKQGQEEGFFRLDFNVEILANMHKHQMSILIDRDQSFYGRHSFFEVMHQIKDHFFRGILSRKGLEVWEQMLSQEEDIAVK